MSQSGQRSLWCDMPQVAASSLLHTISPQTRRLQVTPSDVKTMFDILTLFKIESSML